MSNDNTKTVYVTGTSFTNLLFLVFLVLKLTKVIDWSWWWITAPLWVPLTIVVAIFVVFILAATVGVVKKGKHGSCW